MKMIHDNVGVIKHIDWEGLTLLTAIWQQKPIILEVPNPLDSNLNSVNTSKGGNQIRGHGDVETYAKILIIVNRLMMKS